MSKSSLSYGLEWPKEWSNAQIERHMIQNGGYTEVGGKRYGLGLFQHFKNYWAEVWPDDSQTRWTDLILKEVLENQFVSIIGGGSTWKSGTIARIAMMDYSCFPECTGILVSSTDLKGLEQRIFGEMKMLWSRAHELHDWWPGNVVDHKKVISTDNVSEDKIRDVRNGIIGIACTSDSGVFLGLGKFSGFKNRRVWCISDEAQFMQMAFLQAQENLLSNGPLLLPGYEPEGSEEAGKPARGYRGVFIGNPNPTRPENPLHLLSEPEGGWSVIPDDSKTHVWNSKRVPGTVVKCRTLCLDGADSPNNDFPLVNGHPRWVHLISAQRLAQYDPESDGYWSQGRGVVRFGMTGKKVITKEMCEQFHALDGIIWDDGDLTKIGYLDAAYGGVGGDRCVTGYLEFGKCVDGKIRLFVHPSIIVPVMIRKDMMPEDQIANFCKDKMEQAGVSPDNFFYDGRGAMGSALGRIWNPMCNAIEFGGRPSKRPVSGVYRQDEVTGVKSQVLADEYFSKFVSELWFAVRHVVEADQMRGITLDIILDGAPREYYEVKGQKKEIETKADMKKRTGRSPDLFDGLCIGVEGARRRGFQIMKLGTELRSSVKGHDKRKKFLEGLKSSRDELNASRELQSV